MPCAHTSGVEPAFPGPPHSHSGPPSPVCPQSCSGVHGVCHVAEQSTCLGSKLGRFSDPFWK